jgi:hypothetical protein
MSARVIVKVLLVLLASGALAVFGHRFLLGRYPSPGVAAALTAVLFVAAVVADATMGW